MVDEREWVGRWLVRPRPDPGAMVRLVCFSYAGAGTTVYHGWADLLPPGVEVVLVRLPGRESRIREQPFTSMTAIVQTLAPLLARHVEGPLAFFGHSMGALVAFETARELRRNHGRQPAHLLVSGRHAPHLQHADPPIHALPQEQFIREMVQRYNGFPRAILEEPELLQLYLPSLRGDFAVLESYAHVREAPLDCPISTLGGVEDARARPEELEAWRQHTAAAFSRQMFPGGHFYLNEKGGAREALLRALSEQLIPFLVP